MSFNLVAPSSEWSDPELIPPYVSVLSVLVLLGTYCWTCFNLYRLKQHRERHPVLHSDDQSGPLKESNTIQTSLQGQVLQWSRFGACIVLIAFEQYANTLSRSMADFVQCMFYAYLACLALVASMGHSYKRISSLHLTSLFLVNLAVYMYTEVWPLALVNPPKSDQELALPKGLMWFRFGLVAYSAVVVPLFTPFDYVPVDPEHPYPPPPEQTASLFSSIFFFYMDSLILKASTRPHLPASELPPVADLDRTEHLRKTTFPNLDPMTRKTKSHIFWAFLQIYADYWAQLTFSITAQCITSFLAPVAIYQLLHYVETSGKDAIVRPWFWVMALFAKSIVTSVADHWYLYVATKMMVRTEGIITQLVFEHALRIRMKEDVDSSSAEKKKSLSTTSTPQSSAATLPVDPSFPEESPESVSTPAPSVATPKKDDPSKSKDGNLIGRITNLITSDLDNILEGRDLPYVIAYIPLKIALSIWFLWVILGWSVFVGMTFMLVGFYVPGKLASLIHHVQIERSKLTDERVQSVTEIVGLLRLIKMFAWEARTEARLHEKREKELAAIRKYFLYTMLNNNVTWILPLITLLSTYATYTLIMKQPLNAATVFSSLGVLESLREAMYMMLQFVPMLVTAKVSLDRVDKYLRDTELLDAYAVSDERTTLDPNMILPPQSQRPHGPTNPTDLSTIGFRNAQFTWTASSSAPGDSTPSRREFVLRLPGDITFEQGALNLIVGPTASGKSSVLLALLGELHFDHSQSSIGAESWYNLPREGGVSYCAQESWVMNQTIKDNILFGSEYDETRYKQVIYECALKQDLALFEAGDATEVGERGLTLSGGQKARVSLARAVYSRSSIVLLDDVLSALDVHTIKWIVDKCFSGKLLRGRTILLVTHNLAITEHLAKKVIRLSVGGVAEVMPPKAIEDAIKDDGEIEEENQLDDAIDDQAKSVVEEENALVDGVMPSKGKLIADEEVSLGHVSLDALLMYLRGMGGTVFWTVFLASTSLTDLFDLVETWWLGQWADQYSIMPSNRVNVGYYLGIYTALVLISTANFSTGQFIWIGGTVRVARSIHDRLVRSILHTTLRFLDKTPVGRIIQRFTKDVSAIDNSLSRRCHNTIQLSLILIGRLIIIVAFAPSFLVPGIALLVIGGLVGQVYIRTQLPVKREMSNSRAPVISHFGASINGLVSIRAYGAQELFKNESMERIDKYTRTARPFWNLNRWIGSRIDFIGGVFSSSLAGYLVYFAKTPASEIGFLLNCSLLFTELLLYWIRELNDVEVQGNSLERVQQYLEIEQEKVPTEAGTPPAYWPSNGNLAVQNLSARYSSDGPEVLHNLSFECKSGDKIGIVGRTGSGKSSLTLSLLRLIPTTGEVFFDGLPTSKMNLGSLRGGITIIPQQPELMSGSIRENLDPFAEHDDAELNDALRSAGLFALQEDLDEEERVTLDTIVSSSGGNFSLGQRQIIALARALVRRSRVLILDEATASMDHKTDALIQVSLRTQFKDCTVITIAHRLHTIMDSDKVLVLDAGNLAEFEAPATLLAASGGIFKEMVDGSGDREALYGLTKTVA